MSTIPKTIEQVLFDNEKLLQDLFYKQTAEDQADDFLNKVDAVRRLLNAAFQAGREHVGESKWIPVSERLPEATETHPSISVDVLVSEDGLAYDYSVCYYRFDRKKWLTADLSSTRPLGEVTHWQPLPTPPTR